MRVYEKVRAYIDEMGYKQVTIAEKAGIPKATFNAILNGNRTLYTACLLPPLRENLKASFMRWATPLIRCVFR